MRVRLVNVVSGALLPVSLEQIKGQCRVDHSDEDVRLEEIRATAVQLAADRCKRTLVPAILRLTLDKFSSALMLPRPPVTSIVSVKYIDLLGAVQTLDPQDYLLDEVSEPGYVVPAYGRTWPATQDRINAVTVDYQAGYEQPSAVPLPIIQWILMAATDLYERRGRSGERQVLPLDFAEDLIADYRIESI